MSSLNHTLLSPFPLSSEFSTKHPLICGAQVLLYWCLLYKKPKQPGWAAKRQHFVLWYMGVLVIVHLGRLKSLLHSPSAKMSYLQSRGSKSQVLSCCLWEPGVLRQTDDYRRLWSASVEKRLIPHLCRPLPLGWWVWAEEQGTHQVIQLPLKLPWGALPGLLNWTPKQGSKMDWTVC